MKRAVVLLCIVLALTCAVNAEGCIMYCPEPGGQYVVPVQIGADSGEYSAMELLELLKTAQPGYLSGITEDESAIYAEMSYDDAGLRVLDITFENRRMEVLDASEETRLQFLASLALTLLSNDTGVDVLTVHFEGTLVTGVPGKDGELIRIPGGIITAEMFVNEIAVPVGDTFVSLSDCTNPYAILRAAAGLGDGDILSVKISGESCEVDLSKAFYEAHSTETAEDEHKTVYSIVNALYEYLGIKQTRLMFEGHSLPTLAGNICLSDYLWPII